MGARVKGEWGRTEMGCMRVAEWGKWDGRELSRAPPPRSRMRTPSCRPTTCHMLVGTIGHARHIDAMLVTVYRWIASPFSSSWECVWLPPGPIVRETLVDAPGGGGLVACDKVHRSWAIMPRAGAGCVFRSVGRQWHTWRNR